MTDLSKIGISFTRRISKKTKNVQCSGQINRGGHEIFNLSAYRHSTVSKATRRIFLKKPFKSLYWLNMAFLLIAVLFSDQVDH